MNEIRKLPQKETNENLRRPPSQKDVTTAIKNMASEKAPGKSGVMTNMLKNLPRNGHNLLKSVIQIYWQDNSCDYVSLHTDILSFLYKGKGDSKDPENWRPICLKEMTAKITSTIIQKCPLDHHNTIEAHSQFGHIGWQEALHSLRNLLITRRHHDKEFFILFVDLVKTFDTINQSVMFTILEKYGILHELLTIIKKLYINIRLPFVMAKKKHSLNYTNGVFQGNNASPILFLLLYGSYGLIHNVLSAWRYALLPLFPR